ncbi:hypothetical protein ABID29_000465 [Streptococcus rupicaprae]|uniref:DUF4230 domain-containing protein n=2 Tax=Streptococcus rupicaprae TaxID=759619 RepID=A0ABV2FFL4_9STRE
MPLIKKFFKLKMYVWMALAILLLAGGFNLFGYITGRSDQASISQSYSSVKYLEQVQEVVLLNVGLQRVESKKENTKIPWTKIGIPASEKRALIVLDYDAKMGIKKPVTIKKTGEHDILVKVPKFEAIGVQFHDYKLYDDSGDLLSFATKKIDTGDLATSRLSNKAQKEYLEHYQEQLQQSADNYYKSIITAINPEFNVTVEFTK